MPNNKKLLIGGIILSVIITIGLIIWWVSKKPTTPPKTNPTPTPPTGGGSSLYTDVVDPNKILHKGDKSNSVQKMQEEINKKLPAGSNPLFPDGDFGTLTDTALKNISNNTLSSANNNASINSVIAFGAITLPTGSGSGSGAGTGSNTTGYAIGDDLRAVSNVVNVYDSANFSTANLIKTVDIGRLLGTYLSQPNANVLEINTYRGLFSGYGIGYVWKSEAYKG